VRIKENFMNKTMLFLAVIVGGLSATCAAAPAVIKADNLNKPQLRGALKRAPDSAIIEFRGERKTKAQWRADEEARFRVRNPAQIQAMESERASKVFARQQQLDAEQDSSVEAENQAARARFLELRRNQEHRAPPG
jgi:hypothetical protein